MVALGRVTKKPIGVHEGVPKLGLRFYLDGQGARQVVLRAALSRMYVD